MNSFHSKHNPFRSIWLATLSLTAAMTLVACGGGGNSPDPLTANAPIALGTAAPTPTSAPTALANPQIRLTGKLMNVGYLGNTQVCFDANGDGFCGVGEPSTISAADGSYTLAVPSALRGTSLLAVVRPASVDSASTPAAPIQFKQGWTWATLLEYSDNTAAIVTNISPITATYYARVRLQGRARLNNQIAMFTRVVFEPNLDTATGALLLPVDFDYVANPRNNLSARLKAISTVLDARAQAAAAPLDMLNSTAVMFAWYNTYTAPTATAPGVPVDATKIAAFADTSTSSAAYYVANDFRYFRPNTEAALRLRDGLTETAGWYRKLGSGALDIFDRRAITLSNGTVTQKLARWSGGLWGDLSADEGAFISLNAQGKAVYSSGLDYLSPRDIVFADGNRVTARMPNSNTRWAFDVADSPGTNFFIEEWIGEQRNFTSYYNGVAPTTGPLTVKPSCAVPYPNYPQPNNTVATNPSGWFGVCFDYFAAEYYDKVLGDINLKGADPKLPGANFYDAWLQDALLVAPLTQSCGSSALPMEKVTTLGKLHCNWAVDAKTGHSLTDLFAPGGVALNSWTKTYGTAAFTVGNITTPRTAGTAAQAGLPQQLRLTLVRSGTQTSGTGTLSSDYGAWTATSFTPTVETVNWQISSENPNMVLISYPFRDVNDPRVKTNTASDGSPSALAPVLPAGHFTAVYNGNTFSVVPPTHTAPNLRKLAIVLQDGAFVTGQFYGNGFTYNERYFTIPAMARGIAVLNAVFAKLYAAGFTDAAK